MKELAPAFDLRISQDVDQLALRAAADFSVRAAKAIQEKGFFAVALSGGNTPKVLFDVLSKGHGMMQPVEWNKVKVFWSDERYVAKDHKDSNYKMALDCLLSKVNILPTNVYPMPTENSDPAISARQYEATLRSVLGTSQNDVPRLDLVYLGMGTDGHTASLFPYTELVDKIASEVIPTHQLVGSQYIEKVSMYRLTFLPNIINAAACVTFLVAGEEKAETLVNVLHGAYHPKTYPSQLIHPDNGELIWFVDEQAAGSLTKSPLHANACCPRN